MNVLFSFVGARDPAWQDVGGAWNDGPLLSLLAERAFDQVHLFFNIGPEWNRRASQTLLACQSSGRCGQVSYVPLDVLDVTDHAELFRVMNHACQNIQSTLRQHREPDSPSQARIFVATASGTPAMQTIWVLLVQSGLLPGTLLHITHPQHARQGQLLVREIDLSLDDFPHIQSPSEAKRRLSILQAQMQSLRAQNAQLQVVAAGQPLIPPLGQPLALEIKPGGIDLRVSLQQTESAYYALALEQAGGNATRAAQLLSLSPHAFRKRAAQLGLRPRKPRPKPKPVS